MDVGWFAHLFKAAVIILPTMVLLWIIAERIKNAGIVDVFWAASFGLMATMFATTLLPSSSRLALLLTAILPWSIRLTVHLARRFLKEYPHEDGRYHAMREAWGPRASFMMFWVFQLQGVLIVILSLPFAIYAADRAADISIIEITGGILCTVGFAGEWLADEQLRKFKSSKESNGKVCATGLWYYSRHPNYFFEWLVWVGIFVLASGSPSGPLTIYAPLLMFYLLTKVSGVKLTEEHAGKSRGEDYIEYQRSTSSFFPLPKKKKS